MKIYVLVMLCLFLLSSLTVLIGITLQGCYDKEDKWIIFVSGMISIASIVAIVFQSMTL